MFDTFSCHIPLAQKSAVIIDVIIGMDILSQGDIALTGDSDGLVFSMRFPSKKEPIDFSKN